MEKRDSNGKGAMRFSIKRVSMAFSEWKKTNFLAFFVSAIFLKNSVLSE